MVISVRERHTEPDCGQSWQLSRPGVGGGPNTGPRGRHQVNSVWGGPRCGGDILHTTLVYSYRPCHVHIDSWYNTDTSPPVHLSLPVHKRSVPCNTVNHYHVRVGLLDICLYGEGIAHLLPTMSQATEANMGHHQLLLDDGDPSQCMFLFIWIPKYFLIVLILLQITKIFYKCQKSLLWIYLYVHVCPPRALVYNTASHGPNLLYFCISITHTSACSACKVYEGGCRATD